MIAKGRHFCFALALAGFVGGTGALAQQPSAQEIVRRADKARFPEDGFEVLVKIRTFNGQSVREERLFKVLSKGNENTVVMTLEPAAERGQVLLMKGNDLWMFLPRVSQPVRLSLAQRLVGQVSNGDIARANFAGDYHARILGNARVGNDLLYALELTAVNRSVTYQRVRYWVRQVDFRPYRAEFYSLSNRLLKVCDYQNYATLGGKVRPTRLVMTDALNKGELSTLEYSAMKPRDLPDQIFSKEYLRRLQ